MKKNILVGLLFAAPLIFSSCASSSRSDDEGTAGPPVTLLITNRNPETVWFKAVIDGREYGIWRLADHIITDDKPESFVIQGVRGGQYMTVRVTTIRPNTVQGAADFSDFYKRHETSPSVVVYPGTILKLNIEWHLPATTLTLY